MIGFRQNVLCALVCLSVPLSDVFASDVVEFSDAELSAIRAHGPWPIDVPDDPGNELSGNTQAEQLGQQLFNDRDLVESGVACVSCHVASRGFSDGRALAEGIATGVRNTQGLLDVGSQRWFGWDGGSDSLWAASIRPMFNASEMGGDVKRIGENLRQRHPALLPLVKLSGMHGDAAMPPGDTEMVVTAGKSIAAYLRTLQSPETAFDVFRLALLNNDVATQAQYSQAAKRGLKLFLGEANCRVCHFGPNFSNGEFHDTGRPFFTGVGQVDPGRYTGIQRVKDDEFNLLGEYAVNVSEQAALKTATVKIGQVNWGQWRTPSLRNLTHTAPYMHDGGLATLRDVVDAYADIDPARLHTKGESILKPLDLNEQQRNDLVAFLESLSAQASATKDGD